MGANRRIWLPRFLAYKLPWHLPKLRFCALTQRPLPTQHDALRIRTTHIAHTISLRYREGSAPAAVLETLAAPIPPFTVGMSSQSSFVHPPTLSEYVLYISGPVLTTYFPPPAFKAHGFPLRASVSFQNSSRSFPSTPYSASSTIC